MRDGSPSGKSGGREGPGHPLCYSGAVDGSVALRGQGDRAAHERFVAAVSPAID
jgi:hypothetical protein